MEDERKTRPRYTAQRYLNSQSALSFDGVDDYIDLGNKPEYNFTTEFSISCWARINGDGSTSQVGQNNKPFSTKGTYDFSVNNSTDHSYFLGYDSGGGKFTFKVVGTDLAPIEIDFANINHTPTKGIFYHVVSVYKASEYIRLYVNGILVGERTTNIPISLNQSTESLFIGLNSNFGSYLEGDLSHLSLYNKALDQGEVSALHTWKGHIPESAQPNLVEYQPLQYNDFVNDTVFKDVDTNTFPVNQTTHGLNVGDIIAYDDTSWSNYTNILPMQTPQVVVEVVDADNFVYSESGKYTFPSAHNLGNTGDIIYRDGTTIGKDNPIYKILSPTEIQIASELALWCVGARKQFNWKKASGDVLEESYGKVFGKAPELLRGVNEPTARDNSTIEFYGDDLYKKNWRVYDEGTAFDYDYVNNWNQFNASQPISIYCALIIGTTSGTKAIMSNDFGYDLRSSFYFLINNGKIRISIAPNAKIGLDALLIESIDAVKSGKHTLITTYDGSKTPSGVRLYVDGVELTTATLVNTITGNDLSNPKNIMRIGSGFTTNGNTEAFFFDGEIKQLEIINRVATPAEIADASNPITGSSFSKAGIAYNITNYLLAVDMDQAEGKVKTIKNTPYYDITSYGKDDVYTNNPIREIKSDYPEIYQGIHLQNINAGGDRDMWIELNKSELPNASDDFTFHWSGYMNSQDIPILASTGNPFFVISSFTTGTWNNSLPRIQFIWWTKIPDPTYSNWLNFNYISNSYIGSVNDIKIEVEDPLTLTVTREKGIVKQYLNGILVTKGNTISNESFDLPSTIMQIGSTERVNSTAVTDYANNVASSFGYWKRALSNLEILHLHGEGKPNNPWDNLPSDYNTNMKQELKIWHQFQEGSIYQDGTDFKIKNWANDTGSTDAVLKEANATGGTLLDLQGWRDRVKSLK